MQSNADVLLDSKSHKGKSPDPTKSNEQNVFFDGDVRGLVEAKGGIKAAKVTRLQPVGPE